VFAAGRMKSLVANKLSVTDQKTLLPLEGLCSIGSNTYKMNEVVIPGIYSNINKLL